MTRVSGKRDVSDWRTRENSLGNQIRIVRATISMKFLVVLATVDRDTASGGIYTDGCYGRGGRERERERHRRAKSEEDETDRWYLAYSAINRNIKKKNYYAAVLKKKYAK